MRCGGAPSDMTPGESGAAISGESFQSRHFTIYSINIRCLLAHLSELHYHLDLHKPDLVFVQETWLNSSIENICVPGYVILSRRDRSGDENRGGIIAFVREDVRCVVHLFDSSAAERSWHLLHTDIGSFALANWYRPGAAEDEALLSLRAELEEIVHNNLGTLVAGDLNIHHARWLVHSNGNSPQGEMLHEMAHDFALKQLVREPTRQQYLLDLCLSNTHGCKVSVEPSIADHKALLITLPGEVPNIVEVPRKVWHFRGAAWQNLCCAIRGYP